MQEQPDKNRNQDQQKNNVDYLNLYYGWRNYDLYQTFFAITGLIVACIDLEYTIRQGFENPNSEKIPRAMDDPRNKSMVSQFLKCIVLITTLLSVICLIQRHRIKIEWRFRFFKPLPDDFVQYKFQGLIVDQNIPVEDSCDDHSLIKKRPLWNKRFILELFVLML